MTYALPSSDPVQMSPRSRALGAMVKTVEYVSTPVWSRVIGPPEGPSVAGSARVRSGEMRCQLCPSLVVFHTCCVPV